MGGYLQELTTMSSTYYVLDEGAIVMIISKGFVRRKLNNVCRVTNVDLVYSMFSINRHYYYQLFLLWYIHIT